MVGSNIVNVLLVLGISAIVLPIGVSSRLVRSDLPILIGFSVLTLVLALDGGISRADGAGLLGFLLLYFVIVVTASRRRARDATRATAARPGGPPGGDTTGTDGIPGSRGRMVARHAAFVVVGVALLVLGARLLVSGATGIAQALGLSDLVIGLTVVSIGTSLPELATSVTAAIRGEREMALGNVAGSNIFNLGMVLGTAGIVAPGGVPVSGGALELDLPFMVAVALAFLPLAFTGYVISRFEGAVLVGYFVAYTAYLLLDAAGHDALEPFSTVMLLFVVPLTVLSLVTFVSFELGVRSGRRVEREAAGQANGLNVMTGTIVPPNGEDRGGGN